MKTSPAAAPYREGAVMPFFVTWVVFYGPTGGKK
ncbi:MAG: hypothetical protein RIS34_2111 [Pseudomonadota bacterium]|jgi:hypothetical protein